MAKPLSPTAITANDITEYLRDYSDFSFELKVLSLLTSSSLGFLCEHAGVYQDPITQKTREYDIRARKTFGIMQVRLAVECKNLRPNYPLIIHGMKRRTNECFHELIVTRSKARISPIYTPATPIKYHETVRIGERPGVFSIYRDDGIAGKHSDQVGRHSDNRTLITGDGEVFEKMSQALNSSYDLINESFTATDDRRDKVAFILPVLVVPDSTLWLAICDERGNYTAGPQLVNNVSLFVAKTWSLGEQTSYTLSHLEVVQFSELRNFLLRLCGDSDRWDFLFDPRVTKCLNRPDGAIMHLQP